MEPQPPVVAAPTPPPSAVPVESVPSTWPGAFGIFKYSRNAVRLNIWTLLGLGLIYVVVTALSSSVGGHNGAAGPSPSSSGVSSFISILVSVLLSTASAFAFLAGVRGVKMSIGEALSKSLPLYLKALGLSLLTFVITVASLLLLVVPFFIIMPRLELAMYFLVDQKLGPIEALKASWEATRGNAGKVWGIYGAVFVMALLIFVLVGIYFIFMYGAAFAVLYVYLLNTHSVPAPAESAPLAPVAPQQ